MRKLAPGSFTLPQLITSHLDRIRQNSMVEEIIFDYIYNKIPTAFSFVLDICIVSNFKPCTSTARHLRDNSQGRKANLEIHSTHINMHNIIILQEDSTVELTSVKKMGKHTNNRQEEADASPQQQMQNKTSTAKCARSNR